MNCDNCIHQECCIIWEPNEHYFEKVETDGCVAFKDKGNFEKEVSALRAFKNYFEKLYGTGLEISGWHQNGSLEEFDNFFDDAEHEYNKIMEGG